MDVIGAGASTRTKIRGFLTSPPTCAARITAALHCGAKTPTTFMLTSSAASVDPTLPASLLLKLRSLLSALLATAYATDVRGTVRKRCWPSRESRWTEDPRDHAQPRPALHPSAKASHAWPKKTRPTVTAARAA